jgi:hypothetical protein
MMVHGEACILCEIYPKVRVWRLPAQNLRESNRPQAILRYAAQQHQLL